MAGLMLATLAGCGPGDAPGEPTVVVTTSILGDVVRNLVGDDVRVEVLMPDGVDPHAFAPSARQAAALRAADVLVQNGLGFEAGLEDTLEAAAGDGAVLVTATDGVDVLGDDPHFFTDPVRMRDAATHIADSLADHVEGLDTPAFRSRADRYLQALEALDDDVATILAEVPTSRRTLVTNHEVFAYLADRYGFTVLGSIVPGGSTLGEPSASALADLAAAIEAAGVPAVFVETSSPTRLAEALAAEGRDVDVVELYSEALGGAGSDGATYIDMVRANARRIAEALS